MKVTGEATRTISSTAVADNPSGSACHRARWSGFCDSRWAPRVMALRVVSLPATANRMKKGATSLGASRSSPRSVWTRAEVRSSVGFLRRSSAISFIRPVRVMPAPSMAPTTSSLPVASGSPEPRITLVASSTVWNSLRGMPIMSQMISRGNGCEMAWTRSTSPCSHMPSMTSVQIVSTESSTPWS